MPRATWYPPELRERATGQVRDRQSEYLSECAAIQSVAGKLEMTAEIPGQWRRGDEIGRHGRPGGYLWISEHADFVNRRVDVENVLPAPSQGHERPRTGRATKLESHHDDSTNGTRGHRRR